MAMRRDSRKSGDIERRLRVLEQQLGHFGHYARHASVGTIATAGGLREFVASTLIGLAEWLRGGIGRLGRMKFGGGAAPIGNGLVNRCADEIRYRPVLTLVATLGIGILIGLAARRGS